MLNDPLFRSSSLKRERLANKPLIKKKGSTNTEALVMACRSKRIAAYLNILSLVSQFMIDYDAHDLYLVKRFTIVRITNKSERCVARDEQTHADKTNAIQTRQVIFVIFYFGGHEGTGVSPGREAVQEFDD